MARRGRVNRLRQELASRKAEEVRLMELDLTSMRNLRESTAAAQPADLAEAIRAAIK